MKIGDYVYVNFKGLKIGKIVEIKHGTYKTDLDNDFYNEKFIKKVKRWLNGKLFCYLL